MCLFVICIQNSLQSLSAHFCTVQKNKTLLQHNWKTVLEAEGNNVKYMSSLQMPKSNLRAQYCWRCATWVYFRAAGQPTPKENICRNISKTSVCILLKSAYDGGQELWEKWTDFSKAWDAVNHSSPLLSHLLWYFSHMSDKWMAQFWGGKMLDVNGKAREKNANVREKKWLAGRRNWRRLLVWLRFYKSRLRKQPHN